ncbi:glycine cleavage system aminomethyltransferase GcvT [Pseudobdellovibrio exovorus]|uniref:Aminomethyltransferase n=1 Tax=Pseudobdellovibrio exovorus JSS TaxID=1184267 RepID=M4VA29_9BACT|nr:glycine cleavage system aminomethyltransferase GcvT [Pseudobdellovibrio exovorus]AGH94881.1 aminomethyltransferase [Pseudobdellovibrio exovorus JSS]
MTNTQKTPLYNDHVNLKARMVDFAGWLMPIQYEGLKEEHQYTRQHAGLFDVSHMGEIRVKGPKAVETLQWLTTNDVSTLENGQAHYSLLPNAQGGLVDDIFIYCLAKNEDYLVCVNASNTDKDFAWMTQNNRGADITNESSYWGQIAIQGPKALQLCDEVFAPIKVSEMPRNQIVKGTFEGHAIMIATTGYTGEKGCEVFIEAQGTSALWNRLLGSAQVTAKPIGLGARDTLRTEMKFSLYGHEIDDNSNPYEAGLGWVIKPKAKDFIAKDIIVKAKEEGLKRKLVGLKMLERGIPRQGYELKTAGGEKIGFITSGTHSPTLDEPIGIAYVESSFGAEGTPVFIDIRGKLVKAQVVKTPFVNKG